MASHKWERTGNRSGMYSYKCQYCGEFMGSYDHAPRTITECKRREKPSAPIVQHK